MLVAVVPQVAKQAKDMHKELPFLTAVMIAVANFLIHYWYVVIVALVIIGYFVKQYFKTDSGIKMKDTLKLNIPMFSGMFRSSHGAIYAHRSDIARDGCRYARHAEDQQRECE